MLTSLWYLLPLYGAATIAASPKAAVGLPIRGWELSINNETYLLGAVDRAAHYGVNHLQLTHKVIDQIDEALVRPWVPGLINRVTGKAHAHGMRVYVWSHEINRRSWGKGPPRFCIDPHGAGQALWRARKQAYRRFFELCPEVDGVVLTLASSPAEVWKVRCDGPVCRTMSNPDRIRLVIEQVGSVVCGERGKELIVRSFVHTPQELAWMGQALRRCRGITVMTKCVPQDWQPFYPDNPLLGDVGGLPQLVELDVTGEYLGMTRLMWCCPKYLKRRLDHAVARGVKGFVARVDRLTRHVFGTPNEVNVYALSLLGRHPDTDVAEIWRGWVAERYRLPAGSPASQSLISCLASTHEALTGIYYVKGFWAFAKNSGLPASALELRMLSKKPTSRWDPNYLATYERLLRPSEATLAEVAAEKDRAIQLTEQALADLRAAGPMLSQEDRADLERRLKVQRWFAEGCKILADTSLRYPRFRRRGDPADRRVLRRRVGQLRRLAGRIESDLDGHSWPADPVRLRVLARQLERALERIAPVGSVPAEPVGSGGN